MDHVKILVPIGCRSDEGLSAPVIKRLKDQSWCEVRTVRLAPQNFKLSYEIMEDICKAQPIIGNANPWKPDLVLITGDRVEMCAAAAAAFHNKVKIAHLYAGVTNNPVTTFDDVDRHCISLWSDIQFCEGDDTLWTSICLKEHTDMRSNSHIVGITHLDDLEIDETLVQDNYVLVLINHEPLSMEQPLFYAGGNVIHIGGNPDGITFFRTPPRANYTYYPSVPRSQFLGLLKNCKQFITNSSAAIYEAPYFLKEDQIVMIGDRNRNRQKVKCEPGGSDKIVSILREYTKNI